MGRFTDFMKVPRPQAGSGEIGSTEFSPSVVELIRLGDSFSTLHAIYRKQWAVRTCVNFLAANMAHLNLKTYEKVPADPADPEAVVGSHEVEEIPDHPLAILLQRPNPYCSRFELIRDTVSDLAIYANAFWWKWRFPGTEEVVRIYRIPPAFIQPKEGSFLTGPAYYELSIDNGEPKRIPVEDIVHFSTYNPLDSRIGSPILYALKTILAEEVEASRHRAGFWAHSARRDGIIERPIEAPKWSDVARERFRESFQEAHSGSHNAGKAPILEEGMKWNPDTFSPRESEFIAGRQWALDTVAIAYQIPLAMLSRTNTATFASMKEFHKVLYVDVLGPWSALIEGTIALHLVPEFVEPTIRPSLPNIYVEFNIEEKLQGDFEQTADAYRSAVQVPWLSPNDARKQRNLPRIDDPAYDKPARPQNYKYEGDPEEDQATANPFDQTQEEEDGQVLRITGGLQ